MKKYIEEWKCTMAGVLMRAEFPSPSLMERAAHNGKDRDLPVCIPTAKDESEDTERHLASRRNEERRAATPTSPRTPPDFLLFLNERELS